MNRPGDEPREHEHPDQERQAAADEAARQDANAAATGGGGGELEQLRQERDHLNDQLRRSLADVQNMRRRAAKEAEDSRRRIVEGLMHELLPVLDNFELALHAYGEQRDKADATSLFEGIRMVESMLTGALERHGLQPIHALGERFDPDRHEALAVEPQDGVEAGEVIRVLQTGYRLGDRVLRHAKVVVSGDSQSGQQQSGQQQSGQRSGGQPRGADERDQTS